jgi:IS30 family transposase
MTKLLVDPVWRWVCQEPPCAGRCFSRCKKEVRRVFWELITEGISTEEAGERCGISHMTATEWFRENGGMSPFRQQSSLNWFLSFAEREKIALGRAKGWSVREIARHLARSPSTISRELRRGPTGSLQVFDYVASVAQLDADRNAKRPKPAKLVVHQMLREYVQDRLSGAVKTPDGKRVSKRKNHHGKGKKHREWVNAWSPEQITKRLLIDFPDDESMRISHEAIYQSLYIQGRGALKRELVACLRTGRALRVPRARTQKRSKGASFVTGEVMIRERPKEAEDRAIPGHWEGDLIIGSNSSAIGTLVERTTRTTLLLHLPPMPGHKEGSKSTQGLSGHGATAVRDAITTVIGTLPKHLCRSLTWDQGSEMAQHAQLTIDTGLPVYFCDPHSPWQRGTNENTNGLLRQYFPKGTNLSEYTVEELEAVAFTLNNRPRKTLGWKTPFEALIELFTQNQTTSVASTA